MSVVVSNREFKLITHIYWMAQTNHQAHHMRHKGDWRSCPAGMCDSTRSVLEYMKIPLDRSDLAIEGEGEEAQRPLMLTDDQFILLFAAYTAGHSASSEDADMFSLMYRLTHAAMDHSVCEKLQEKLLAFRNEARERDEAKG